MALLPRGTLGFLPGSATYMETTEPVLCFVVEVEAGRNRANVIVGRRLVRVLQSHLEEPEQG